MEKIEKQHSKDIIEFLLFLFALENFLALLSLNLYYSILIPIIQSLILILTIISIFMIHKNIKYGHYISLFLSILIIYSGLFLYQNNIITFIVKEVASPYYFGENPIVLSFGLLLFIFEIYYMIKYNILDINYIKRVFSKDKDSKK